MLPENYGVWLRKSHAKEPFLMKIEFCHSVNTIWDHPLDYYNKICRWNDLVQIFITMCGHLVSHTLPLDLRKSGRNAFVTRRVPHRFTSATVLKASTLTHSTSPIPFTAALFTNPHKPETEKIRCYINFLMVALIQ